MRTSPGAGKAERHLARLLVAGMMSGASSLFAQQSPSPSVQLLTPTIDIGPLVPSTSAAVEPALETAPVRVISDRYWQLAIVRDPAPAPADDIRVSVDGVNWMPLTAASPVPLGAGPANSPQGVLIPLNLRIVPTFDLQPGRRQYTLGLLLNGSRAEVPLRLTFEILPAVALDEDSGQFDLIADHPSERREYDFNPRTYFVHSNVPWVLEITPGSAANASTPYTVEALSADGSYKALTGRITLATGPPTGNPGTAVPVRLRLQLGDVPVAGRYSADVKVVIRIASAPMTAVLQRTAHR